MTQSPAWGSREGRALEAALCVMKQEVDMQAMQVRGLAWVAQSPAWGSRKGRALEAALCVMKQEVDMQAMQVRACVGVCGCVCVCLG